jgi:hypothetical protein
MPIASATPAAATTSPGLDSPGPRAVSAVFATLKNESGSCPPRRWHPHVLPAPDPEDHRSDEHEDARNAEGHRRAVLAQENRHQQRGEERAEVDRPVEGVEDDLGEVLVGLGELVADEGDDERLDAAGPERDEEQPEVEAAAVVVERRQTGVAGAVDEREPHDRRVLAEETVRQPAAEQREEVDADDEAVEDVLGDPARSASGA